MTEIDFAILNWIQAHLQCGFFDWFWRIITTFGNGGFGWIGVCLIFLIFKRTRRFGFAMGLSLLFCYITFHFVIKGIVQRPRPYVQSGFKILIGEPSGTSFPSGHAAIGFTVATFMFLFRNKIRAAKIFWIPVLVLAVLIDFSRLYLYVHFPSDVIAGTIYGMIVGTAGYFLSKRFVLKKNNI